MSFLAAPPFERLVLNDTCSLLLSVRQESTARAAMRQMAEQPGRVHDILSRHKAFTFFHAVAIRVIQSSQDRNASDAAAALLAASETRIAEYVQHQALLQEEIAWLEKLLGSSGSGIALIKGASNCRFYPTPSLRWSRDVDVFVPSWEVTTWLLERLRQRGYAFDPNECPWIKADPARGRSEYGQVFLVRPSGPNYTRIDLHFGTYSVSFGDYLRVGLSDYADASVSSGLARINATGALLLMFAHALSDGYVSIKDANDVAAIATAGASVDWHELRGEIARHSFGPQAAVLAHHLKRTYDTDVVANFAVRLHEASDSRGLTLWRMHNRDWTLRAAVNATYSFRAARQNKLGLLVAVTRCIRCLVHYLRRLKASVRRRSYVQLLLLALTPKADLSRWQLRPDACPTLVHMDHPALKSYVGGKRFAGHCPGLVDTPLRGVAIAATPRGSIIRIRDDVFIPTWDQIIDPAELQALCKLVT